MKIDPIEEWRRLTQLYREMSDDELIELDADFAALTEPAQKVLRDEMKSRRLQPSPPDAVIANSPERPVWERKAGLLPFNEIAATAGEGAEEDGGPYEYTWKTPLCECNERTEAWQIYEVLKRAGIESWLEGPGFHDGRGLEYPRVVVAADQLQQARAIVAQPIPQEIVEQCELPVEEFKLPVCPQCGAEDPVLESADPVNRWLCESCGRQWSDPVTAPEEALKNP